MSLLLPWYWVTPPHLTVDVICESTFREEGNRLYVQGRIEEAEEKYKTAIGMLEQLMLRYGCILVNKQHFLVIYCLARLNKYLATQKHLLKLAIYFQRKTSRCRVA